MSEENQSSSAPSNPEPASTRSAVPMWIIVATLVLLFLGFVYFDNHSGWFDPKIYTPYASAEQLDAYQPRSGAAATLAQGKKVYETYCGICHGPDGQGKPATAPPLAGSEWVNAGGIHRLTEIPLAGLNGPIKVKGQPMTFASGMVPIGAALSDAELAAVLTYIRSAWGNKAGEVTADDVKTIRASLGAHSPPMTSEQLMKMPE
ncbi:MAG TPA: cytochrome c [Verrucomicrobiae bacterium]